MLRRLLELELPEWQWISSSFEWPISPPHGICISFMLQSTFFYSWLLYCISSSLRRSNPGFLSEILCGKITPADRSVRTATLVSSLTTTHNRHRYQVFAMATNITFHPGSVNVEERVSLMQQRGITIWLTGLSASGKVREAQPLDIERQPHDLFLFYTHSPQSPALSSSTCSICTDSRTDWTGTTSASA